MLLLPRLQLHPSTLNSLLAVLHCLLFVLPVVTASCKDHVKKYCGNINCQQALMTKKLEMQASCQKLRDGLTDECDAQCQTAITELLSAYNGSEGLFTCNCTDTQVFYRQEDCELDRRRLSQCPPLVALLQREDDQSSPCIAASQDCESDAACKSRLDAYLQSCNPEQSDPETTPCSRECMGALEALYTEPLASNFWECGCEDTPEEWCRTSPLDYLQLCQVHNLSTSGSPEVPYKPLNTKPTSPPTKVEEPNQQQGTDSKDGDPGNSAPSVNIQVIYQIGLFASIFGVLYHI